MEYKKKKIIIEWRKKQQPYKTEREKIMKGRKKILFTKDLEIKCIMICSQWTEALVSITGIARVRWHEL